MSRIGDLNGPDEEEALAYAVADDLRERLVEDGWQCGMTRYRSGMWEVCVWINPGHEGPAPFDYVLDTLLDIQTTVDHTRNVVDRLDKKVKG